MKIIISKQLNRTCDKMVVDFMKELLDDGTVSEGCYKDITKSHVPCDEIVNKINNENLVHISASETDTDIEINISDTCIIACLQFYMKIARPINAFATAIVSLMGAYRTGLKDLQKLALMKRDPEIKDNLNE